MTSENLPMKPAAALLQDVDRPSVWPNANARLLGLGVGLPVKPLDRLAQFSAAEFERFTLEWATDYLAAKVPGIEQVQQRGGAGDKGRDVVVWLDPIGASPRRWSLYQCKHYKTRLGWGSAATEIGKLLFYNQRGDYAAPVEYWFVTHLGVTSDLQDKLDDPAALKKSIIADWDKYCRDEIRKDPVPLDQVLRDHIATFDFTIFKVKQPLELLNEHAQTRYHLTVFGLPLIERIVPKAPPSSVAPTETVYISKLLAAISEGVGAAIADEAGLALHKKEAALFRRSRLTFYCAENLRELARDSMANVEFFDSLLQEFADGLYHTYNAPATSGLSRLSATVQAAQSLQLTGHMLNPHVVANDREGMCHQLANEDIAEWVS
ncbi:ABC-three component system protein [Sphingomonas sp. BK235]|uniref:ABC-three component system protein n=1 Tax=Sphingomonas sp. BK235 TaxID=2512131 RepID=UPI0010E65F4B|nr:ABC-three component system protein [Sphingomonas sp. BK235]TCP32404.1 hypothetical protein EV292_10836 [Sphingomonas sp. BK235]